MSVATAVIVGVVVVVLLVAVLKLKKILSNTDLSK